MENKQKKPIAFYKHLKLTAKETEKKKKLYRLVTKAFVLPLHPSMCAANYSSQLSFHA